jgi:hypothetical protein
MINDFIMRFKKNGKRLFIHLTDWRYKRIVNSYNFSGYERIYFIHIPKTGGTSLNKMFLSLCQEDTQSLYRELVDNRKIIYNELIFAAWNVQIINKGNYFYAFSHLPLHQLNLPKKTFTITIFRDPVERVLSHYKMLKHMVNDEARHPGLTSQFNWLGDSFDDFIERIPKEFLLNQLYMFSEEFNIDQALKLILDTSHFFYTNEFFKGTIELNKKLGLNLKPIHLRRSVNNILLPDESIARLRDKLELEYKLLSTLNHYTNTPL